MSLSGGRLIHPSCNEINCRCNFPEDNVDLRRILLEFCEQFLSLLILSLFNQLGFI